MISFAAITPHPPLLIPNIGKDKMEKLAVTKKAFLDLEEKIKKAKLDSLLIISSSAEMHSATYGIILSEKYKTDFKEFGDFTTKIELFPDVELIEKIRHTALDNNLPFNLSHNENLDYNFSVPLFYLLQDKKIKVIPFVRTYQGAKEHYELGRLIKKILAESNKKIGIIVSGNLSHRSNEKSPLGFSKNGKTFNDKFIELLETKNNAGLLSFPEKIVEEANESILLGTAMLMGIIDKINYKPQIFSFEAPLGIGYLVCNFKLI
ncbi:MEMO1 family protein [Patescibacteria group bacterium]|nr:MEMO1 family protein [Patescibacteria group bacterium]